jgi:hypothetical protein
LETDFDKYAVVFSCYPIPNTIQIMESFWLLSRKNVVDDEKTKNRTAELIEQYFDKKYIRVTKQGDVYVCALS